MRIRTLTLASLAFAALSAHAGISLSSASSSYSQNFNGLASTGSTGNWTNDSTVPGWSLYVSDKTSPTLYGVTDGTGTIGGIGAFHGYGAAGSGDRTLGVLPTANGNMGSPAPAVGTTAAWMGLALTNNTGATLGSFTLSYAGEQWRTSELGLAQTATVQYGFGNSFASVSNWVSTGTGFGFSTPVQNTTVASINGNTVGRVAGLGGTVSGLNWTAGDTMWIRWSYAASAGPDGFGIDDVGLSVSAVPEPGSVALMLAGMGVVGLVARRRRTAH